MSWEDFIREALTVRIADDSRYLQERLGYIPTDEEVSAAVDKHVSRTVDAMAEYLDHYESDVWFELERED
jgi:hypothetical protein